MSKIEGIDVLAGRFDNIYKNMKQKSYDILDHRKTDFDHDFEEFKVRINELEVMLVFLFLIFFIVRYLYLFILRYFLALL